jgi:hypothetical protein
MRKIPLPLLAPIGPRKRAVMSGQPRNADLIILVSFGRDGAGPS